MFPRCAVCGAPITFNKRRTNVYCSDKCKQVAYRQRAGITKLPLEAAAAKKEHYDKIIATKRAQVVMVTCQECDRTFEVDQTRARTMYCSRGCKQKHYRENKAEKEALRLELARTSYFEGWEQAPEMIRAMGKRYLERHGFNWTLLLSNCDVDSDKLYVDTSAGEHFVFATPGDLAAFMAFYIVKGRPDFKYTSERRFLSHRWGGICEIIANCGEHQPEYLRAPDQLLLIKFTDGKESVFQFAHNLRAKGGLAAIEAAWKLAPAKMLSPAELHRAFTEAE